MIVAKRKEDSMSRTKKAAQPKDEKKPRKEKKPVEAKVKKPKAEKKKVRACMRVMPCTTFQLQPLYHQCTQKAQVICSYKLEVAKSGRCVAGCHAAPCCLLFPHDLPCLIPRATCRKANLDPFKDEHIYDQEGVGEARK